MAWRAAVMVCIGKSLSKFPFGCARARKSLQLREAAPGQSQMPSGLVQVAVDSRDPGLAPVKVTTGFGAEQAPLGLFEVGLHKGRVHVMFAHLQSGGMQLVAD